MSDLLDTVISAGQRWRRRIAKEWPRERVQSVAHRGMASAGATVKRLRAPAPATRDRRTTASAPDPTMRRRRRDDPQGSGVFRTEIDGIPTFWIDQPGPLTASLSFRVGMADESLPTLGISHLVEHLALFPQSNASCSFNGRTEDTRTLFYATGSPEEVCDFLNGVCKTLNELPVDRIDTERRILFTEANGRPGGFTSQVLSLRFGPTGHGLPAYPEHGLRRISGEEVGLWVRQRFTRGNATLALTGPPPRGLNLALHNGHRYPTPKAVPVAAEYPTVTVGFRGGVGCSFIAERSSALTSLIRIIQRRAVHHLRTEKGISYAVDSSYQRLDDDQAHLTIVADALPDQTETVLQGLLTVLEDLARDGPTQEELDRDYEEAARAYASEDAILGDLANAARYELFGEDPKTQQQLLSELRDVTPAAQAAILNAALNTSLWVIPPGTQYPTWRFRPFLEWSTTRVQGQRLRRRSGGGSKDDTLMVAPDGLSLARGDRTITIRFADCAAMLCWESGERVLYGRDGFVLDLTPGEWRNGDRLLSQLDAAVDPARRVPMGEARPVGESRSQAQLGDPTEAKPKRRIGRRKDA